MGTCRWPVPFGLSLIFVIVCYIDRHILNQLIWVICHVSYIYIYHILLTRPDFVYHWLGVGSFSSKDSGEAPVSVACSQ